MPRKNTTNQQKVISGTFREDRASADVTGIALDELPNPPHHLDKDAVALYNDVGEFMISNKLLNMGNLFQFINLCDLNSEVVGRGKNMITASHIAQIQKIASDLCITTPTLMKHGIGNHAPEANPFAGHGKQGA